MSHEDNWPPMVLAIAAALGALVVISAPLWHSPSTAHAGPLNDPPVPMYSTTVEVYVEQLPDLIDPDTGEPIPLWDLRVSSSHLDALTCEVCWQCRAALNCCGARRIEALADVSYGTTTVKGAVAGADWRCWEALGAEGVGG